MLVDGFGKYCPYTILTRVGLKHELRLEVWTCEDRSLGQQGLQSLKGLLLLLCPLPFSILLG